MYIDKTKDSKPFLQVLMSTKFTPAMIHKIYTFEEEICLFSVCFGGDVWVGFIGRAGFNGDLDDVFSSTSWVVRPAAEIRYMKIR